MNGLNILLVEDSRITRKLVSFALKDFPNTNITEASDGMDGLKKLSAETFHLLIVDINMPVMDGLTMVQEARKIDAYRDTPVLIISIESDDDVQQRARALGVNAYICKPTRTGDITQAIRALMGGAIPPAAQTASPQAPPGTPS